MQAIRTMVVNRLQTDQFLITTLALGGIYDRPLKSGKDAGATPSAFWIKPNDPARIVRLRESIVVMGPNEVSPGDGPIDVGDPAVLRVGFLRVYYYVPATAQGKTNLDAMDDRVRVLLNGWQGRLDTEGGYPVTFSALDLSDALDTDDPLPGTLVATRRFSAEYFRPV